MLSSPVLLAAASDSSSSSSSTFAQFFRVESAIASCLLVLADALTLPHDAIRR